MKHTPVTATRIARRFLQRGDSVLEIGAADGEHAHAFTPRNLAGARLEWEDAQASAVARRGPGHVDVVMVPDDLMEADW